MGLRLARKADWRQRAGSRGLAEAAIESHLLPQVPGVLQAEDPMPLSALKLLAVLLEECPHWASILDRQALASLGSIGLSPSLRQKSFFLGDD